MLPKGLNTPLRRVGRPEKPLDPASSPRARLAEELRELRRRCGVPTLRILANYAHVDQRRLGEASGDGTLPSWQVVESYVRGCWYYFESEQHSLFPGAGDLERWRRLYREAGGHLRIVRQADSTSHGLLPMPLRRAPALSATEIIPAQANSLPHHPLHGFSRKTRPVISVAAGLILVVTGIYAAISRQSHDAGNPAVRPASGKQHLRISVAAPAPACGTAGQDDFQSPATTAFSNVTQVDSINLDGVSAAVMQGIYKEGAFDWLESRPTGMRAGIQLRWASTSGHWHYCTATDEHGTVAALPNQVTTIAVPANFYGKHVTFQACIWHQHPYTSRCSNLIEAL
jgi:hypothetical protein